MIVSVPYLDLLNAARTAAQQNILADSALEVILQALNRAEGQYKANSAIQEGWKALGIYFPSVKSELKNIIKSNGGSAENSAYLDGDWI